MSTSSSSSRRRLDPLSKERMNAAHQVYLDMVSDPSINFTHDKKEEIRNQFRKTPPKQEQKEKETPKKQQFTPQSKVTPKKSFVYEDDEEPKKKKRPSLYDPKYPPKRKASEYVSKAKADIMLLSSPSEKEKNDYLEQRRIEAEMAAERARIDRENTERHTREAIKKYRCDKEREKLRNDLKKIRDFEMSLQMDQLKRMSTRAMIPSTYMVEIKHDRTCMKGEQFLTQVSPPKPRNSVPQPISPNYFE